MNPALKVMILPFKKIIINLVKKYIIEEESKVVDLISEKLTIPNMSPVKEKEIITNVYDVLEEIIVEVLNRV